MKLTRYEHLVQIKDMKIMELKKELEAVKKVGGNLSRISILISEDKTSVCMCMYFSMCFGVFFVVF